MRWASAFTRCAWWSGERGAGPASAGRGSRGPRPHAAHTATHPHPRPGRRGDHTYAECCLTVVARGTEAVVFSIDGSFTASVSIMGSDPKVRAGAVDVVR